MIFWLAGLCFGWRWAQASGAAWRHALQLLFIMLVAMTAMRLVQRWRVRRGKGEGAFGRLPLYALALTKLALVASALAVEYLLRRRLSPEAARTFAGAGLGVAFAVIGLALHRRQDTGGIEGIEGIDGTDHTDGTGGTRSGPSPTPTVRRPRPGCVRRGRGPGGGRFPGRLRR